MRAIATGAANLQRSGDRTKSRDRCDRFDSIAEIVRSGLNS
ncbi:hypothetical protein [Microcoleus sp. herbarium12]